MKAILRGLAVVFALLICHGIATAQSPPTTAEAPVAVAEPIAGPADGELGPAEGSAVSPDAPITLAELLQDPVQTSIICGNEFTCRQICLDDCQFSFNACQSGCGSPGCQFDCFLAYQGCVDWCYTVF